MVRRSQLKECASAHCSVAQEGTFGQPFYFMKLLNRLIAFSVCNEIILLTIGMMFSIAGMRFKRLAQTATIMFFACSSLHKCQFAEQSAFNFPGYLFLKILPAKIGARFKLFSLSISTIAFCYIFTVLNCISLVFIFYFIYNTAEIAIANFRRRISSEHAKQVYLPLLTSICTVAYNIYVLKNTVINSISGLIISFCGVSIIFAVCARRFNAHRPFKPLIKKMEILDSTIVQLIALLFVSWISYFVQVVVIKY